MQVFLPLLFKTLWGFPSKSFLNKLYILHINHSYSGGQKCSPNLLFNKLVRFDTRCGWGFGGSEDLMGNIIDDPDVV